MRTQRLRLSLLLLGVISSACAASEASIQNVRPTGEAARPVPFQSTSDQAAQVEGGSSGAEAKSAKDATPVDELEEGVEDARDGVLSAQQKVQYAEAEEQIAQLEARASQLEVSESLRSAAATLDAANRAHESFVAVALPLKIRESELGVAQSEERLHVAETDLVGIREIYAEETEARAKDEIIRRHEKQVVAAGARLGIARDGHAHLVDHELAAEQEKLAEAVRKAEAALGIAEAKAEQARQRVTFDLRKAKDAIEDAKRASKRAQKKLERAAAKLDAAARQEITAGEQGR